MSTIIGSLKATLGLDGSAFLRNSEAVRKDLGKTKNEFGLASRKAENFAEEGLAKILPVSSQVGDAMIDLVGGTQKGAAALQIFAKGFIAVAGIMAVAEVVQQAQHWRKYGETIEQTTERLKKHLEEEKKFAAEREKARAVQLGLDKQIAQLEGRDTIAISERERQAQIIATVKMGEERNKALAKSEQITYLERKKLRDDYEAKLAEGIQKEIEDERKKRDEIEKATRAEIDLTERLRLDAVRASGDKLRLIDAENAARKRGIEQSIQDVERRNAAFASSDAIAAAETTEFWRQYQEEAAKAIDQTAKAEEAARQERAKAWIAETQTLVANLKAQQQARQQFESQIGTGAAGLGIKDSATSGLRRLIEARQNLIREQRDIAHFQREGLIARPDAVRENEKAMDAYRKVVAGVKTEFKDAVPVVEAADRAIDGIGSMDGFIRGMSDAQQWLRANVITTNELAWRIWDLKQRLTVDLPAGVSAAAPEIQKLTNEMYLLKAWTDAAIASFRALASVASGGSVQGPSESSGPLTVIV
jgi:hypothetical protein